MEPGTPRNDLPPEVIPAAESKPENPEQTELLTTPSDESIPPSSSPVSAIESTFSPRPHTPSRRLSTSTSISSTSFYSFSTSESHTTNSPRTNKTKAKIKPSCLQCTTLGLRCTLPREPLRRGQDRSTNFCLRCAMSGERFCILQHGICEEFWADGVDDGEVMERVEELGEVKRERWIWCLPKIPPGTRAGLRRVFGREGEVGKGSCEEGMKMGNPNLDPRA